MAKLLLLTSYFNSVICVKKNTIQTSETSITFFGGGRKYAENLFQKIIMAHPQKYVCKKIEDDEKNL